MDPSSSRGKHSQQISEEAAEWFVDFREGDVDAAGVIAFHDWLRTSPEHIEAYLEISAWWADVPNLITRDAIDVQALRAYAHAEDNVVFLEPMGGGATAPPQVRRAEAQATASTPVGKRSGTMTRRPWRRVALAAAIVFGILGTAAAVWFSLYAATTYTTGIGEQRLVALEDGSTVEMDANSRIRVRFTEHERTVDLVKGQALFRVAKNAARPFIVVSGDTRVRAVGTQFDVYRKASKTSVTVIEGRVAVLPGAAGGLVPFGTRFPDRSVPAIPWSETKGSTGDAARPAGDAGHSAQDRMYPALLDDAAAGKAILVDAGEQVIVSGQKATAATSANVAAVTAWTQRQIVFRGAPLTDVVEEFNRYNRRQMVITAKSLEGIRISGVFSSTDPDSLLAFLRQQVGLTVVEHETQIEISPR